MPPSTTAMIATGIALIQSMSEPYPLKYSVVAAGIPGIATATMPKPRASHDINGPGGAAGAAGAAVAAGIAHRIGAGGGLGFVMPTPYSRCGTDAGMVAA